jgi:hypothetical protein
MSGPSWRFFAYSSRLLKLASGVHHGAYSFQLKRRGGVYRRRRMAQPTKTNTDSCLIQETSKQYHTTTISCSSSRSPSYDRSKESSKVSSPHRAIQYLLVSLSSSSCCLCILTCRLVPSIFPSVTSQLIKDWRIVLFTNERGEESIGFNLTCSKIVGNWLTAQFLHVK